MDSKTLLFSFQEIKEVAVQSNDERIRDIIVDIAEEAIQICNKEHPRGGGGRWFNLDKKRDEFIQNHKQEIIRLAKSPMTNPDKKKLIRLAREFIGYSEKTNVDIIRRLYRFIINRE